MYGNGFEIVPITSGMKWSLRNHKYERTDTGLYLPGHGVRIGGILGNMAIRKGDILYDWEYDLNIVTDEGINHVLNVTMHDTAKTSTWYVAPHTAGSPATGTTAATYHSTHTETTAYDESTRVEWNTAASTSESITNSANKATFTYNAGVTVTGNGILSVSTKQSTSGVLLAVANYASGRALVDDDQQLITYAVSGADDGV